MIPVSVRAVLVALCFAASAYRGYQGRGSWPLYLLAGLLLVFEYFRGGTIGLAFKSFQSRKPESVRKYLSHIYKVEWLRPSARSYYYFLTAVVNTVDHQPVPARNNLLAALTFPFSNDEMRCYVYGFLAEVHLELGEIAEARTAFNAARAIPHKPAVDSMLDKIAKRVEGDIQDQEKAESVNGTHNQAL